MGPHVEIKVSGCRWDPSKTCGVKHGPHDFYMGPNKSFALPNHLR